MDVQRPNQTLRDVGHAETGGDVNRARSGEVSQACAASRDEGALARNVMEAVVEPSNLNRAYRRVKANRGSPGVDAMSVGELGDWCRANKHQLMVSLLAGRYRPQPIRRVEIPKPGGGVRELGIPTVVDRLVQQALLQVLEPILEPHFSERSYGFRPGRSAHQALRQGQAYVAEGRAVVADIDLEKFFDRVNHDVLMARLARHVADVRVLRVVRRFLEAGIFRNGLEQWRHEGTPQGGPLSPLLANLLLTDLDRELERRGHAFCRYADDCNIYVRSQRSGERVMASVTKFLETKLKLKVNRAKSAVAPVGERKFLGYRITDEGRLQIAPASLVRLRAALKALSSRSRGVSLERMIEQINARATGWVRYFALAHYGDAFREIDRWLRRRLRCARLKQCKRAFGLTRFLLARGLSREAAWTLALSGKGWWRLANTPQASRAMPTRWFDALGLLSLQAQYAALHPSRKPPDTLSTSGGVGGRPA
jgi:RNA-directed DNA polymerase